MPLQPCTVGLFVLCLLQTVREERKMLRRKPTRLELKIDDTAEFESVKKELEVESLNQYPTVPSEQSSAVLWQPQQLPFQSLADWYRMFGIFFFPQSRPGSVNGKSPNLEAA